MVCATQCTHCCDFKKERVITDTQKNPYTLPLVMCNLPLCSHTGYHINPFEKAEHPARRKMDTVTIQIRTCNKHATAWTVATATEIPPCEQYEDSHNQLSLVLEQHVILRCQTNTCTKDVLQHSPLLRQSIYTGSLFRNQRGLREVR